MDYFVGMIAAFCYALFIGAYLTVRPRGVLSVMDMFIVLFSLQFGPHAILEHPFLESALLVPGTYPAYATGLALAYIGLALSIFIVGMVLRTRSMHFYPFRGVDLSEKQVRYVLLFGVLYILFFIAFQGFDLSRTISYLNFFRGDSLYTYTELRREMYDDDAALGLTAVTRQTSSAFVYCALIYVGINFPRWRIAGFSIAVLLFVICCMQMNKFPLLYYTIITWLVYYSNKCYKTGVFINGKTAIKLLAFVGVMLSVLFTLYLLQYGEEIESGVVTGDRVIFRVISRPFTANHDSLYLWFANFPDTFDFIGLSNIPMFANLLGVKQFAPTIEIPALYVSVATTYQAGYIGSLYASFGYFGVIIGSLFVGALVCSLTFYEGRLNVRWQRVVFFSVVGMNCYFFVSRELHTALQSGGLVLAPLMMVAYRTVTRSVRRRARNALKANAALRTQLS